MSNIVAALLTKYQKSHLNIFIYSTFIYAFQHVHKYETNFKYFPFVSAEQTQKLHPRRAHQTFSQVTCQNPFNIQNKCWLKITRYNNKANKLIQMHRETFICWARCLYRIRNIRKLRCNKWVCSFMVRFFLDSLVFIHFSMQIFIIFLSCSFRNHFETSNVYKYLFNRCISLHETWKLFKVSVFWIADCSSARQNQCGICDQMKIEKKYVVRWMP